MQKDDYQVQKSYRIRLSLLKQLEDESKETKESQNELVNKALEEYFKNKKPAK